MEKTCNDASRADKKYGVSMASKLHQRIDKLITATSVEELIKYNIGHCHLLKGNRKGQYAMDLIQPARLIFTIDKKGTIQIAEVSEIVDYH